MKPELRTDRQEVAKRYRAPQIILELELEVQAGSPLALPDLEGEIGEMP